MGGVVSCLIHANLLPGYGGALGRGLKLCPGYGLTTWGTNADSQSDLKCEPGGVVYYRLHVWIWGNGSLGSVVDRMKEFRTTGTLKFPRAMLDWRIETTGTTVVSYTLYGRRDQVLVSGLVDRQDLDLSVKAALQLMYDAGIERYG